MSEAVQFEFRPEDKGGLVRIDPDGTVTPQAKAVVAEPTVQPVQPAPLKAFAPGVSTSGISPKHVVRAAKQRVKEIRAELKNKRALERELAQLENLLTAARKPTHLAAVRQLATRK